MPLSNALIVATLRVLFLVLDFYMFVLIAGAVLSWLIALDIVNPYSRAVRMVGDFCQRVTEPLLRPIRRRLPHTGGIDLAPMALILGIVFIKTFIGYLVAL